LVSLGLYMRWSAAANINSRSSRLLLLKSSSISSRSLKSCSSSSFCSNWGCWQLRHSPMRGHGLFW
jgi:hypothetical protein